MTTSDVPHADKFFLPVPPKATERTRSACRGRFVQVYLDPKYREWRGLAEAALKARPLSPYPVDRAGPIKVTTEVVFAKPKTTKLAFPRGDLDNLEKGIWDAITVSGRHWVDDNQIVESRTTKRWALGDEDPGYHITVEYL